jgi:Putative methionine and alanine importer, small subunit
MSVDAIVMMVLAMAVIWGGLVLAILSLRRSPDLPTQEEIHRDL